MKKIFLLLLLCSWVFANDLCDYSSNKINKIYESIFIDLKNNDKTSMSMNFISLKTWVDFGIIYCDGAMANKLLQSKRDIFPKIQNFLEKN